MNTKLSILIFAHAQQNTIFCCEQGMVPPAIYQVHGPKCFEFYYLGLMPQLLIKITPLD